MLPGNENPASLSPQAVPLRQTVLLIDDDAKDQNYFSSLLERMGYTVEAIATCRQAEGRLAHGSFDLVIVSYGSAVPEARQLVRLVLGRNRPAPLLVLTRCAQIEYYIEAMQLGAADCVEKPLSPAEFQRLVAKYCRPRQAEFSALARPVTRTT